MEVPVEVPDVVLGYVFEDISEEVSKADTEEVPAGVSAAILVRKFFISSSFSRIF